LYSIATSGARAGRNDWITNGSSSSGRSANRKKSISTPMEANLIQPAVALAKSAELAGRTTLPFDEQGNIREDMFRELVTADLVIADLSIHNATFLLRAKWI
jgi:hypothetical protein